MTTKTEIKDIAVEAVKEEAIKVITNSMSKDKARSNFKVRMKRVFLNIFRRIAFKEVQRVTVNEVSLDGVFSKIEAEKQKVKDIIELQNKAIKERDDAAKKKSETTEEKIEKLRKKIEAEQKLISEMEKDDLAAKAAIETEKKRGEQIIKNIDKFYGM